MTTLPGRGPWPYPRWIAHRGAGKLAPENTVAAFRLGASHGYRMFECDVKLSADGVPYLLHDSSLARTTNAALHWGAHADLQAKAHTWAALSVLDAGSWHSPAYAGEALPDLHTLAQHCLHQGWLLNLEIKPSPGDAVRTGTVVAHTVARLWQDQAIQPLLSSFDIDALEAARTAQPALPLALLLDQRRSDWLAIAARLGCQAIVCQHALWDAAHVAQAQAAGFRTLSYTVNDAQTAQRLWDLGTDGIITDRVDFFSPSA